MPLIYPIGFFGGSRLVQAPTLEATPWVLPTIAVLTTAANWTNYQNAFIENDTVASRSFSSAGGVFDAAGFRFALPSGAIPYGFEAQLRWSSSDANSQLFRISLLEIAANLYKTDDAVGATINASTALRTDTFQLPCATFLINNPVSFINADLWGLAVSSGSALNATATINIAWVKLRLLYYKPAPGNALILSPERFPQTVSQAADHSAAWTNPNAIMVRDGAVASIEDLAKGGTSNTMTATNFGHALPARALPLDILLGLSGRCGSTEYSLFSPVSLRKHDGTGSQYSGDIAALNSSSLNDRYMFKSSNWGLGRLAPADVNGSGFGGSFAIKSSDALLPADHFIDSVSTRILYSTLA